MEKAFEKFPVLETERLLLRDITTEDAEDILAFFSDCQVMRYYGSNPKKTIGEIEDLIKRLRDGYESRVRIRWGITLKGSGRIIGTCGFHNMDMDDRRAEIGYELARDYWRQGIMSEAVSKVIDYGFGEMSINRIEAFYDPKNEASERLLKKLGFQVEGCLRKYSFYSSEFKDAVVCSILKDEYKGI